MYYLGYTDTLYAKVIDGKRHDHEHLSFIKQYTYK